MAQRVGSISEGCQVINGRLYISPANELIDFAEHAATSGWEAMTDPRKTRGAYDLISDLIAAYCSDLEDQTVYYTLLQESDLALDSSLKSLADKSRQDVINWIKSVR